MTLILTEREVEELLDMPSTLDAVEAVLRDQAEGRATNRARRRVALPTSGLNYMAAGAPAFGALGLKIYTVARSGARFYTMLFDSEGGELLSVIRSDKLGQLRTGAASGVATKHLAREDATTLGLYGTGWQAESQLEAVAAVRDLERVIVHSRSEEKRKAFAAKMSERLGMEIETTQAPEEPAAQDIVVTVIIVERTGAPRRVAHAWRARQRRRLQLPVQERDRPRGGASRELRLRRLARGARPGGR